MKKILKKSGELEYFLMSSADDPRGFYSETGHIFASAAIRKELDGYPINNDDERLWICAFEGERLVGFRSFGYKNDEEAVFFDSWVHSDFRGNGIYRTMIDLALKEIRKNGRTHVTAIANEKSLPILLKKGFEEVRKRGRFTYLRLEMPYKEDEK
ncbi:MAG: GNAT family N-acetyltransferase [Spirochaetota bacterium]|nr:GNAT family N-acetyltransferase [Spirochaetota bacterium]TAH45181.1 MAG: GNAT family N-acetyltransferase [Treponema sp.]